MHDCHMVTVVLAIDCYVRPNAMTLQVVMSCGDCITLPYNWKDMAVLEMLYALNNHHLPTESTT